MTSGSRLLLRSGTALAMIAAATPGLAISPHQDARTEDRDRAAQDQTRAEEVRETEIIVVADRVGLIETTPGDTLFGLDKSLVDTPRAATFVSDQTLLRYGIEEVDDLIAIAPGAFTASFYGVKGSVSLRGTLAETYYRGFKRIENRGTYQTPLAAAESVEILRGPPTSLFGPGKVGGFLNISPRTGRGANGRLATVASGDIELTLGSYEKFNLAGNLTVPLQLGTVQGGLHAYAEIENSGSFYRGISPEHQLVQLAADFDLDPRTRLSLGGLYYNADGYVQTPGWNRLTQELIDNGTYITGRDTTIVDTNNDGFISPAEIGTSLVAGYFGSPPTPNARFTLDEGIGTATIDRRTVFVSNADFSESNTLTLFTELARDVGPRSRLRLQGFYDSLENKRAVSYGFPAWYDARVFEVRASGEFPIDVPALAMTSRHAVGVSHRDYDGKRKESFNSGFLGIDRRDLVFGPTPGDTFSNPFREPGMGWDIDIHSKWTNTGAFLISDIEFGDLVNVMLGARYDWYDLDTVDTGLNTTAIRTGAVSDGDFTWNASISLNMPFGLRPYFTYAESSALEGSQAGDVSPALIANGQWLSDSDLLEGGIKFNMLGQRLVGALSVYRQNRTRLAALDRVIGTIGEGIEFEARALVSDNISATIAGNRQKTTIKGPDTSFIYIPAYATGLRGDQVYGGTYAVFNFATSPLGFPGNYEQRSIPASTLSGYVNYISDDLGWGAAGGTLGIIHVSSTATKLATPVVFPAYQVVNASAFVRVGQNQVTLNINNLFDARYFQPVADTYVNMAALPGRGREWRIALKRSF